MNFIKKYFLKRKLKKKLKLAIESICTFDEDILKTKSCDISHFMCVCLYRYDIPQEELPNFNRESFSLFIKEYYPSLIQYLSDSSKAAWMDMNHKYYPDEEITKAKKHFLTYIMNNL